MRVALDTNILACVEGVNDAERQGKADALLLLHDGEDVLIPAQVLAELFWVLSRKLRLSASETRPRVELWASTYPTIDTDVGVLGSAMDLVARHRIRWWDAIVLASAAEARCSVLFSEDMQHGFVWRGVTVRNPFID